MVRTMRDPGVIRLVLLGGVDALDASGHRIEPLLAQPRRLALLAMLAIEAMHGGCPRERLMATFWPEHSPEAAAANLRQAVAFLRGLLGEGLITGQGRHALAIDWQRLQCDAVDALRRQGSGAPTAELMPGFHLKQNDEAWEEWLAEQRRRLAPPRGPAASETLPADPRARAAYLHGRFHWTRRPRESMKALACLQQAVELAPDFAPAHAALADVYNTLGSWESGALAPAESFPRARALARRALQIDPCCAAAHTSLAYATAHHDWHWAEAEAQFSRAIELDPGYAHAHHWRAHLLVAQQRFDEALQAGQRALELQPLDIIINVHMAWHHWLARDAQAAIEQAARTADLDETDHWPPFFHGMACTLAGRAEEAVDALRRSCALSRGNAVMRAGLGYAYAFAQDRRAARAVLREFDDAAEIQHRFAYEAAVIHATLGDADRAFARLQDALHARSAWLTYLRVDPRLDGLRDDPRYLALESAVGLE
jgi:tetratricopeptide (TPR) repeat protein